MQAERDVLREKVIPRIRQKALEWGEDINEIDLRWGVDTSNMSEDESSQVVLKVCIDAINRCIPFMIVFLGERYGWIPSTQIMDRLNDERVNRLYEENMSVTNLEIAYGVFEESRMIERCIFCFRDKSVINEIEESYRPFFEGESSIHKEKLLQLKQKIEEREGLKKIYYTASWNKERHCIEQLDGLADELTTSILEMLQEEFRDRMPLTRHEKQVLEIERIKEKHLSVYTKRKIAEAEVWDAVNRLSSGSKIINVCGKTGSGKTAFLCGLSKLLSEKEGIVPILYINENQGSMENDNFEIFLCEELEKIVGKCEEKEIHRRIAFLTQRIKRREKIVVLVDDIDKLYQDRNQFLKLRSYCRRTTFIISSLQPQDKYDAQYKNVVLSDLNDDEISQMICSIAASRGKKVDDELMKQIVCQTNSRMPQYISSVLQRFFMMNGKELEKAEMMAKGMEGIHLYMKHLLKEMPVETLKMNHYLLKTSLDRLEDESLWSIVCMLAISEDGLTEMEMSDLLTRMKKTFRQVTFTQMVSLLYDVFQIRKDGAWYISSASYLECILNQISDQEYYRKMFCEYALENHRYLVRGGYKYLLRMRHEKSNIIFQYLDKIDCGMLCRIISGLESEYLMSIPITEQFIRFWTETFWREMKSEKDSALVNKMLEFLREQTDMDQKLKCKILEMDIYNLIDNEHPKIQEYVNAFKGTPEYFIYAAYYERKMKNKKEAVALLEEGLRLEDLSSRLKFFMRRDLFYCLQEDFDIIRIELLEEGIAELEKEISDQLTMELANLKATLSGVYLRNEYYDNQKATDLMNDARDIGRMALRKSESYEQLHAYAGVLWTLLRNNLTDKEYKMLHKEYLSIMKKIYEINPNQKTEWNLLSAYINLGKCFDIFLINEYDPISVSIFKNALEFANKLATKYPDDENYKISVSELQILEYRSSNEINYEKALELYKSIPSTSQNRIQRLQKIRSAVCVVWAGVWKNMQESVLPYVPECLEMTRLFAKRRGDNIEVLYLAMRTYFDVGEDLLAIKYANQMLNLYTDEILVEQLLKWKIHALFVLGYLTKDVTKYAEEIESVHKMICSLYYKGKEYETHGIDYAKFLRNEYCYSWRGGIFRRTKLEYEEMRKNKNE